MGITLFLIGLCTFITVYYYDFHSTNKLHKRYGYYYEITRNIIYYVIEITVMFSLFLIIIKNPLYILSYAKIEQSYLKQLIDFYTFYQIGIVIIFRLVNSHYIYECKLLLHTIEMIRMDVELESPYNPYIDLNSLSKYNRPLEISIVYAEMNNQINQYRNAIQIETKTDIKEREYLLTYLNREKEMINSLITMKESEWQVSLLIRILSSRLKTSI